MKKIAINSGIGVGVLTVILIGGLAASRLIASAAKVERERAAESILENPQDKKLVEEKGGIALPLLLAAVKSRDSGRRLAAVRATETIGETAKDAVPDLQEILKTEQDTELLSACIGALTAIGSPAASAAPELLALCKHNKSFVAIPAMRSLLRIGPDVRPQAVPVIVKVFRESSELSIRQTAVECLGELGPASQEAVPVLIEELQKSDSPLPNQVIPVLARINATDERVVNALVSAVSRPATLVSAAQALRTLGPAARNSAPVLYDAVPIANQMCQRRLWDLIARRREQVSTTHNSYRATGELVDSRTTGRSNDDISVERTEYVAVLSAIQTVSDGELAAIFSAFNAFRVDDLQKFVNSKDDLVRITAQKALAQSKDK